MVSVGIIGLGAYVPPNEMSNEDWMKYVDTSDEWISSKTGMKKRRIAAPDVCTSDLAVEACKQALENAGLEPEDIDLIILATSSPDVPLSSTAGIIQEKLGCIDCAAFDINAVCAGWVHALDIGSRYVGTKGYQNVIVVGSEIYSRILNWKDRATCVLFGDGSGAVVLKSTDYSSSSQILSNHLYSDGDYKDMLYVDGGPSTSNNVGFLRMDGGGVFKHAVKNISSSIIEALNTNNMTIEDVDWFVPHQANSRILEAVAKKININKEKIIVTVDKHANTSAASIPLALNEANKNNQIKKGDIVLLAAMGGGFTWGSSLIRW